MAERKARISYVPRKVRDLKADLRMAGFAEQRGRGHGSHKVWAHPLVPDADVNGSYNIGRKALPNSFGQGIEVVAVRPVGLPVSTVVQPRTLDRTAVQRTCA